MPIYEYQCQSCGHRLEKLQRLSDAPLTDCPDCHAAALRRLVSAAAFRLKGSGWYETDFKKDGKKNLHEAGGSDASAPAKSEPSPAKEAATTTEATKTESKPAAAKTDSA